jgi:hypothetical protein
MKAGRRIAYTAMALHFAQDRPNVNRSVGHNSRRLIHFSRGNRSGLERTARRLIQAGPQGMGVNPMELASGRTIAEDPGGILILRTF